MIARLITSRTVIALFNAGTDYESGKHVISGQPVTALTVRYLAQVHPLEIGTIEAFKDANLPCRQVEQYLVRSECFSFHKNRLAALHNLAQCNARSIALFNAWQTRRSTGRCDQQTCRLPLRLNEIPDHKKLFLRVGFLRRASRFLTYCLKTPIAIGQDRFGSTLEKPSHGCNQRPP